MRENNKRIHHYLEKCFVGAIQLFVLSFIAVIIVVLQDFFGFNDDIKIICAVIAAIILSLLYIIWDIKNQNKSPYRKYLLNELQEESIKSEKDEASVNQDVVSSRKDKKNNDVIKVVAKNANEIEDYVQIRQKQEKRDIIALMLKNNDEITEYFTISKNQAKSSFWFSVISCVVGMVALAVGIYGIVVQKNISVSVISLISGSISEVISGTVFWVHNKSALQLNHYYNALHENEKFLAAINMADKLSEEKREEMYIEIIRKQIGDDGGSEK